MKRIKIFVGEEEVFDFDSESFLSDEQLTYLDKMDIDMSNGIKLNGELIESPDGQTRTKFIVLNLVKALGQDNQAIISSSCAYISHRNPALREVKITKDDNFHIELVLEQ